MPANDAVAENAPGIGQEHSPGIGVEHTTGIAVEHAPGLAVEHSPSIAVEHAPGLAVEHSPSIAVEHAPGLAEEHSPRACDGALVRAFSFLGKRWNGVILATLFNGTMGFAELRRSVGAISDSVLSDRLTELATAGLVERRVQVGPPVAVEYRLTPAGEALLPAMNALTTWSRTNLPA